ncbi:MAG: hypothetical protein IPI24_02115 [Ignavibacteria bacterium]|nr:hypothetical protein [Ignavibacteria bacterium]
MKTLILPFALICSLIVGCANDTVNPDPHQNVDETALSAIGALGWLINIGRCSRCTRDVTLET